MIFETTTWISHFFDWGKHNETPCIAHLKWVKQNDHRAANFESSPAYQHTTSPKNIVKMILTGSNTYKNMSSSSSSSSMLSCQCLFWTSFRQLAITSEFFKPHALPSTHMASSDLSKLCGKYNVKGLCYKPMVSDV